MVAEFSRAANSKRLKDRCPTDENRRRILQESQLMLSVPISNPAISIQLIHFALFSEGKFEVLATALDD